MQLFLIGPSGSGKDTQAKLISQCYNLKWFSIGEVLRDKAKENSEQGQYIQHSIDSGNLLDWAHLEPIIFQEITNRPKNFIWTGFPRLISQAKHLDHLISEINGNLDLVINLTLPEDITKARIENRKNSNENVRQDDLNIEYVERRLSWYHESIHDIKSYYLASNRLIEIDASLGIQEVFKTICDKINSRFNI